MTRESLLTDEERAEEEKISVNAAPVQTVEEKAPADTAPARTEDLQDTVVRMLLAGQDPGPLLREKHRMPSIVADDINEALFEEFGDSVIDCEDDRLSIVEDYREDLLRLFG